MKSFNLKLISPEGIKSQQKANKITFPTPDGQITVLPDHIPLITLLSAGEIILEIDGKQNILATEGGIVEVTNKEVKILADTAEEIDSLDQLKIEEAKKHAEQILANAQNDVEYADALAHLEKQLAKLNILKRRKKYRD